MTWNLWIILLGLVLRIPAVESTAIHGENIMIARMFSGQSFDAVSFKLQYLKLMIYERNPAYKTCFIRSLRDSHPEVRLYAFYGLIYVRHPIIQQALIDAIETEPEDVLFLYYIQELAYMYPGQATFDCLTAINRSSRPGSYRFLLSSFYLYIISGDRQYAARLCERIASASDMHRRIYLAWFCSTEDDLAIPLIETCFLDDSLLQSEAHAAIESLRKQSAGESSF